MKADRREKQKRKKEKKKNRVFRAWNTLLGYIYARMMSETEAYSLKGLDF